jgi:nucleoside-diphosphate-sugar epimerase
VNIFITGASGFVGSRLAQYFSKKNFIICNYYNRKINIKNVKKINIDITKKIKIKENIDVIIHCASKTPVNCRVDKTIFDSNIIMMKNLIKLAKEKKVKNFIFLSSVSAFGKIKKAILLEKDQSRKLNIYGKSKIVCENLLYNNFKKNSFCNFLSIRLPGTVGLGSHGNFISETTKKILEDKKIKVSNKNSYFNNIIFIKDLFNFIKNFISQKKKINYKFVNIASKNKIKIKDVIDLLYRSLKRKKNIQWINSNEMSFYIDFRNALKCGFRPKSVKNSIINYGKECL